MRLIWSPKLQDTEKRQRDRKRQQDRNIIDRSGELTERHTTTL